MPARARRRTRAWAWPLLLLCLLLVPAIPARALDLIVSPKGWATIGGQTFRCALGRAGVKADKREGDGATPTGAYPLREVFYRPDRLATLPLSGLPVVRLAADDGWCDQPGDPGYNRRVKLPYAAGHEKLWRADHVYDLIVVVGYNDDPPLAGRGSAIFLHVARKGYAPTAGCIAFSQKDLLKIIGQLVPGSRVVIQGPR